MTDIKNLKHFIHFNILKMSEHIKQLITLLNDPNHLYIQNHIQDIKNLIVKIENDKQKTLMGIEPHGLPWYEQRQFED